MLLHELGHAFMAKQFKIDTLDITLYPIGGVARLTSMPRKPKAEFLIAIAGPAVNLFIAAGLFVLIRALDVPIGWPTIMEVPTQMSGIIPDILGALLYVNLALVGFNMLPAFPMDGGRVLRAGLASQMPYERATYIAATVGQVVAGLMALAGPHHRGQRNRPRRRGRATPPTPPSAGPIGNRN